MKAISLSKIERAFLANQNRMLALLSPDSADYYNNLAEIAEHGYEGLYSELLSHISDGVPFETCEETFEILTMYRVINNFIGTLAYDEKKTLDLDSIQFQGFDANNDDHYHFMEFLIEKEGRYKELSEMYRNSHDSLTIEKYRTILRVYRSKKQNGAVHLKIDDLKEMIAAATAY